MILRPKAVVFDFGGTLFDDDFSVSSGSRQMLVLLNDESLSYAEYRRMAEEIDADVLRRRRDSLLESSCQSFERLLDDCLGVSCPVDGKEREMEFWKASETCRLVPGARDAVSRLRADGVQLGILSNMTFSSAVILHELAKVKMGRYFASVVTSSDYGIRKPHPLAFRGVAGSLRTSVQDCWYVGDRLEIDILGSQSAGMKGIWMNRRGLARTSDIVPDAEVSDWPGFIDLWESTP